MAALTKDQMTEDYDFVCKMWTFWKKYGNPEAGDNYWDTAVKELAEIVFNRPRVEQEIGQAIMAEIERRYRNERNADLSKA